MNRFVANNYVRVKHPEVYANIFSKIFNGPYVPINIVSASGNKFYDNSNNYFFDATSSYCSANFGHKHPYFKNVLLEQINKISVCPRFVDNENLCLLGETTQKYFSHLLNFKHISEHIRILPSLNGVDAFETSLKMSRSWGYIYKRIPFGKSIQLFFNGNFHGRTLSAISISNDDYQKKFYPKNTNLINIDLNNINNLDNYLNQSFFGDKYYKFVSSITIEPIQIEGGINIVDKEKLQILRQLCDKYNILLIVDEIQTGLFRANKLLCIQNYNIKPDIVLLGKSLGAGYVPVSMAMSSDTIMDCIKEGEHGSTFGGYPLGSAIATNVLEFLHTENYEEKNTKLSNYFCDFFKNLLNRCKLEDVISINNFGLIFGIKINNELPDPELLISKFCEIMLLNNILVNKTKKNTIRFTPPFTINDKKEEFDEFIEHLDLSFVQFSQFVNNIGKVKIN